RDVLDPVAVEVGDRQRYGSLVHFEVERGLEGSVSVAQQDVNHAGNAVGIVGDGDVGLGIAIEIAHRHKPRLESHGIRPRRLEGAITVAQQKRDALFRRIGRNHVHEAVEIEIADRHRDRVLARQNTGRGYEAALRGRWLTGYER